ncbi:MAG: FHA domain-containing protein [Anaerolineales bacterium]|nr:FHA domain-containing protein [Anaerolineales bacterium]
MSAEAAPSDMRFGTVEVKYPDGRTAVFELTKRQVALGRASDVDVPINDSQVSRRHALLLCGPEGVRLMDAGSANGTFLGGRRLPARQPVPLPDGAVLRIGTTQVRFTAAPEEAAPAEGPATSAPTAPERPDLDTAIKSAAAAPDDTRPPVPPQPPAFEPPRGPGTPEAGPAGPHDGATPPGVPDDRSTYLKYLPALYSADDFLGRFLLIFESILSPVERTIDNLHHYLDARLTPPEMLPWLASWLGLVLDERWPEERRRELIRAAVELYQWRGTRRGLTEFLRLYTGLAPEIVEPGLAGRRAASGDDAFRFVVRLRAPNASRIDRAVVEAIIDAEKPAHAGYTLEIVES